MARRKGRGKKMRGTKGGAPIDSPYTPDMASGRGKKRSKKRR